MVETGTQLVENSEAVGVDVAPVVRPSTRLTPRHPRPTPSRRPSSRNTGRRPPSRPVHRWRGFTVSPVIARRPQEGETLFPRVVPVNASSPQTTRSTNATNNETAPLSVSASDIAPARCRNCRPTQSSRGPGHVTRERGESPRVQQETAMAKTLPSGQAGLAVGNPHMCTRFPWMSRSAAGAGAGPGHGGDRVSRTAHREIRATTAPSPGIRRIPSPC